MNEKVKMCFIIQRIEIFPSVQSIFEYMCLDARYDVTLLVLPRFDHATNKIKVNTIILIKVVNKNLLKFFK